MAAPSPAASLIECRNSTGICPNSCRKGRCPSSEVTTNSCPPVFNHWIRGDLQGESFKSGYTPRSFRIRVESMSATIHGLGNIATRSNSIRTALDKKFRNGIEVI